MISKIKNIYRLAKLGLKDQSALKAYHLGVAMINNDNYINSKKINKIQSNNTSRTEVINFIINNMFNDCLYLEIGVRNPDDNFNLIASNKKISVDPGIEYKSNPVDFKMTSDVFFKSIEDGKILTKDVMFDVIFIDGLHLAEQVERDINNALNFLSPNGFIILHDCNPPTEFHASENYSFKLSPSQGYWNGTTWKAFAKARKRNDIYSCCVNTDWGLGIISKSIKLKDPSKNNNNFYEYNVLDNNRSEVLGLIEVNEFKELIFKHKISNN